MVSPIYIIAIPLAVAFLLSLFEKKAGWLSNTLFLASILATTIISGVWFRHFYANPEAIKEIYTAGVKPPLSINLQLSIKESSFLIAIHVLYLLGAIYLLPMLKWVDARGKALYLTLTLGITGLIMTRDIFNLFIFLEILAISSYALIGMDLRLKSLTAGFKYALVGSVTSVLLLLGIIFIYSITGTLNLNGIISKVQGIPETRILGISVFLLFFTFFIEAKLFPVNGWALDVYEATNPGVTAIIASGSTAGILFAIYKLLPLLGTTWNEALATAGLLTFFLSNLMGLRQRSATRLLGYSSIAQIALIVGIFGLVKSSSVNYLGMKVAVAGLFINHFIAKAGLYWLAGKAGRDSIYEWGEGLSRIRYRIPFGIFIFSLAGFPPFAGFWGKWALITTLGQDGNYTWIILVLLGSLLEVAYLFRWFAHTVKIFERSDSTESENRADSSMGASKTEMHPATEGTQTSEWKSYMEAPIWLFVALSIASAFWIAKSLLPAHTNTYIILIGSTFLLLVLDFLHAKVKWALTTAGLIYLGYWLIPELAPLNAFFAIFFLAGGLILLLATLNRKEKAFVFFPMVGLMIASMALLPLATSMLEFFLLWELMTVSSYLVILRGKNSLKASFNYLLFSQGSAFLMLAGFALIRAEAGTYYMAQSIHNIANATLLPAVLIAMSFAIKVASIGFHIWAPPAYTEAEDDASPMLSGILSKAGVLGFVILFIQAIHVSGLSKNFTYVIGWLGVSTAFFATLYAVFQEDAKKLLAWSSIGQVGYIVLGLSVMSHLGWLSALWHTVNHMLFKGLLFLAIAGVIYRTGTRNMYEMGGLIKKMPLTFVSVLMGIITLAGMPPLSGFGGKWLLYEALVEKGWLLQAGVVFFSSTIAFLYCFRLIHTIFLGIPKPAHRDIKEAPISLLIPQYVLIMIIMALSTFPGILVKRISAAIEPIFPTTVHWQGLTLFSSLGYWNGAIIMIVTMVVFMLVGVYLFLAAPRPKKVKPFNIVFAGEKPFTPETTHYAYRFFWPYERAMAPLLRPLVKRFWSAVSEWSNTLGGSLRHIYTGDGQIYILYIFIVGAIFYIIHLWS